MSATKSPAEHVAGAGILPPSPKCQALTPQPPTKRAAEALAGLGPAEGKVCAREAWKERGRGRGDRRGAGGRFGDKDGAGAASTAPGRKARSGREAGGLRHVLVLLV